jgi:predicted RNA-binding protein YlxR (DUF448 family)
LTGAIEATEATNPTEGGERARRGRQRMCAVTRRVQPERELIRFVAAPDGLVVADLKANLPGRGIWVGLDRRTVAEAVKRNVFSRGLKRQVATPPDLPAKVGARLRDAAIGRLGLARKAGAASAGFAKVEAALEGKALAALVIAAEAAEDGRRKLEQALRRRGIAARSVPVFRCFGSAELDLAIGRPNVIHAAVLQGAAGRSFVEAALRFQRYEGVGGSQEEMKAVAPQDVIDE